MRKLEKKYADELVVIGVHSAKFATESNTENIRGAVLRHNLEHPVVNDAGFRIWRAYGVNAWPTLVLVGPDGRIIDSRAGEITFDSYSPVIDRALAEYESKGLIDRRHLEFRMEKEAEPERPLYFPSKVLADPRGGRLFIADTGHHRLLVASLPEQKNAEAGQTSTIEAVIGRGQPGFKNGSFAEAAFNEPRGMTIDGDTLYVADTENHAIRAVHLGDGRVETVAGTGEQSRFYGQVRGSGREAPLSSPWDVLLVSGKLYIAMAGSHQIWTMDPDSGQLQVFAGNGREALVDGPLRRSALNQPCDLASDGRYLYIADSEASAIRRADLDPAGSLKTIVGTGLFDFGDADGAGDSVRLQHPLGIEFWADDGCGGKCMLLVSDTYNNKVKAIDPVERTAVTFLGTGDRSLADGPGDAASFDEPGGLSISGQRLYIADTDNHAVRIADLVAREVRTLELAGLKTAEGAPAIAAPAEEEEEAILMPARTVAPGSGIIEVSIVLPLGYKLSLDESFYFGWSSDNESVISFPDKPQSQSGPHPQLPLKIKADFSEGEANLDIEMTIYYCPEMAESLCLIDAPLLRIPVRVEAGVPGSDIVMRHKVVRED